jgi:hypothetical protein
MSTFEVLDRYGTAALARFTAAVALFLVLHLVRVPLVAAVRALEALMRRVDGYATRQASEGPEQRRRPYVAAEGSGVHG